MIILILVIYFLQTTFLNQIFSALNIGYFAFFLFFIISIFILIGKFFFIFIRRHLLLQTGTFVLCDNTGSREMITYRLGIIVGMICLLLILSISLCRRWFLLVWQKKCSRCCFFLAYRLISLALLFLLIKQLLLTGFFLLFLGSWISLHEWFYFWANAGLLLFLFFLWWTLFSFIVILKGIFRN